MKKSHNIPLMMHYIYFNSLRFYLSPSPGSNKDHRQIQVRREQSEESLPRGTDHEDAQPS